MRWWRRRSTYRSRRSSSSSTLSCPSLTPWTAWWPTSADMRGAGGFDVVVCVDLTVNNSTNNIYSTYLLTVSFSTSPRRTQPAKYWCSKLKFFRFFWIHLGNCYYRGHATNCTSQAVLTVLAVGILQRELSMYGTFYIPSSVNFSTLNAFKRSIVSIDFSLFLKWITE